MKRVIAWVLLVALCLGVFAGCKKDETDPTDGVSVVDTADLEAALEYVKTVYRKPSETTPKDFKRIGVVPVNGVEYEVVWTANVGEEYIKIVKGTDGMVTVDVNEEVTEDVKYVLTATISDAAGNSVSHSWNHILPAAVSNEDMIEIVKAAYALASGESMGYDVTLTGKITRINTAWDDSYQNITVTIVIAGAEDMPIQCYRMKGEGAKDLKVGDTITVTGMLKNYNGTIEFDAGCTLDAVIAGETVEAPDDVGQILKDAYALEKNMSLEYVATLTGKITKINSPYNPSYKNVSVTIEVDGYPEYPILCYRIVGDGADSLLIGDTITVEGYIVNYEGTIEFDAGSKLLKVEKTGKEVKAPSDPKQIVKEAYALGEDETLPYQATLTGKITKVRTAYSSDYKNVTVVMVVDGMSDYPIDCYRLQGKGADQIGKGDTITVTGWLTNYKGTVQFAQGCTLDSWKDTGADEPEFVTTVVPTAVKPEVGKAYKFFIHQKNTNKYLYLTGKMDGYYYEATVDPAEAVDVYLEQVSGGYRAYFMDGSTKTYLEMTKSGTHNNVIFTTSPSKTLKWNDEINSITCDIEGEDFMWGTYKNYYTFSASPVSYVTGENADELDVGNFVARFGVLQEQEKESPAEQAFAQLKADYYTDASVTNTPENYERKNLYSFDDTDVKVVWTENSDAVTIVDNGNGTVTVKVTRGEEDVPYTLTATITDGQETYTTSWNCSVPAIPKTDPKDIVNAAYELESGASMADPATLSGMVSKVDTPYNSQYGNVTVTIIVEDLLDKPIMCYRMTGEGADAVAVGDNITVTGILKNYSGTIEFDAGCTLDARKTQAQIVDEVYALESGASLDEKYTLTGVITNVDNPYNETYGNITVTIAVPGCEDKPIQCYRLTGSGVELIDVGYTVCVYGTLKNYNGTYEFDKGCALVDYTAPDEQIPVLSIPEANELGAAQTSGYTDAYQVTGTVVEIANTTYGNMYIADAAGNKLYIYGLYDAEDVRYDAMEVKPVVGDVITVVGGLGQYSGTPQMKNATLAEHIQVLSIDAANALGAGLTADTETKYLVSGTVTEIKNETYGNMYIQDEAGATLYIYGTYDADGENRYDAMEQKPVVGDYVCVYGVMSQYNGSPQMKNGWIVEHRVAATLADANTIGEAVANGQTTAVKYQVTGTVTEIKNETYGNMYIQDEAGTSLYIYGLYDAIGNLRYDAMETKPAVGDTVTVYGVLCQYNGSAQIKNGWLLKLTPAGEAGDPEDPADPAETSATLSFASTADRTVYNTEQQVWAANGITFTNDKNTSTNDVADRYGPVRLYAGSKITVAYTGMTKIIFNCNSSSYASTLVASINDANAVVSSDGSVVTVHLTAAADSYVIPALSAQVRVDEITVCVGAVAELEDTTPEVVYDTFTYAFSSFTGTSTQYANETHDLGGGISLNINKCHLRADYGELRIYSSSTNNGVVIISSEKVINSIKLYAGNNADVLNVYASVNGTDWTLIRGIETTSAYADHLVEMPEGTEYKYVKLDVEGTNQVRVKNFELTLVPLVQYVYGSYATYSDVVLNWGTRGEDATFLSPNAEAFYAENEVTYEALAALAGATTTSDVPSSALYAELQELMVSNHTTQTTYGDTRYLYCFTDCQASDKAAGISAFYTGTTVGPTWDSGSTWNREHCWPKSKTATQDVDNGDQGECADLMTLRPVVSNINSSRNNKAYGESEGFYDPNSASNGAYDLRGDVARIVLYTYVRWGNTQYMWGSDGVIEDVELLIAWMEADPVDTWELARNDSVESVTGTRNVFVDYPELAFVLFGEEIPSDMVTPSGEAAA